MGSVVLAEGVAERVEKDLRGFLGRGKWYAERGQSFPDYTVVKIDSQVSRTAVGTCCMDRLDLGKRRSSRLWLGH